MVTDTPLDGPHFDLPRSLPSRSPLGTTGAGVMYYPLPTPERPARDGRGGRFHPMSDLSQPGGK